MAGGKRMSFRATVVIGDRKGRVGVGTGKGADVSIAIAKGTKRAEKGFIRVPIVNGTIPHRIEKKFGAAVIMLKPAPAGTGIRAGGAVRVVLELAGVPNAVGKIFGSKNKLNNARATILALQSFMKDLNRWKQHRKLEKETVKA